MAFFIFLISCMLSSASIAEERAMVEIKNWQVNHSQYQKQVAAGHLRLGNDSFLEKEGITFSASLPANSFNNPILFFSQLDQEYEIWLDQQLFAHSEGFKGGSPYFRALTWTMIKLPKDHAHKKITIKLKSSYKTIGIMGVPYISEESYVYKSFYLLNFHEKVACFIHLVLFFFMLFLIVVGVRSKSIVAISLYLFTVFLYLFSVLRESKITFPDLYLLAQMEIYALYAIFPTFILCLSFLSTQKTRYLLYFFLGLYFVFYFVQIFLHLFFNYLPAQTLSFYLKTTVVLTFCILISVLYEIFYVKNKNFDSLKFGLGALLLTVFIDILRSLEIVYLQHSLGSYGTIAISFSLIYIFIKLEFKSRENLAIAMERIEKMKFEAVAQKQEALVHLTSGLAHELNNPLTILLQSSTILLEQLEEKEGKNPFYMKLSEKIHTSGMRINKLVESLLALTRLQHYQNHRKIELEELLKNVGSEKENVEIICTTSKKWCLSLQKEVLHAAVSQLLDNAIYEHAKHKTENNVRILVYEKEDFLLIDIVDEGVGVDPECHEKIFNAFFSNKPVGKGVGLGLFLAKQSLQLYGLELEIASSKDPTIFRIRLMQKDLSYEA